MVAEAMELENLWGVEAVDGVVGTVQCIAQGGRRGVAEPRILALFWEGHCGQTFR